MQKLGSHFVKELVNHPQICGDQVSCTLNQGQLLQARMMGPYYEVYEAYQLWSILIDLNSRYSVKYY